MKPRYSVSSYKITQAEPAIAFYWNNKLEIYRTIDALDISWYEKYNVTSWADKTAAEWEYIHKVEFGDSHQQAKILTTEPNEEIIWCWANLWQNTDFTWPEYILRYFDAEYLNHINEQYNGIKIYSPDIFTYKQTRDIEYEIDTEPELPPAEQIYSGPVYYGCQYGSNYLYDGSDILLDEEEDEDTGTFEIDGVAMPAMGIDANTWNYLTTLNDGKEVLNIIQAIRASKKLNNYESQGYVPINTFGCTGYSTFTDEQYKPLHG